MVPELHNASTGWCHHWLKRFISYHPGSLQWQVIVVWGRQGNCSMVGPIGFETLMSEPCHWTHPVDADCNWGWRRTFSVGCSHADKSGANQPRAPRMAGGPRVKWPYHRVKCTPLVVKGLISSIFY